MHVGSGEKGKSIADVFAAMNGGPQAGEEVQGGGGEGAVETMVPSVEDTIRRRYGGGHSKSGSLCLESSIGIALELVWLQWMIITDPDNCKQTPWWIRVWCYIARSTNLNLSPFICVHA